MFDFLSRMWNPDAITVGTVVGVKCAKFSKGHRIVADLANSGGKTRDWEYYFIVDKDVSGVVSKRAISNGRHV